MIRIGHQEKYDGLICRNAQRDNFVLDAFWVYKRTPPCLLYTEVVVGIFFAYVEYFMGHVHHQSHHCQQRLKSLV